MKLKVHYDPDCDAIGANYKQPHDGAREVEGLGWVVIDLLNWESHVPVGLEVIGISRWLPLGKRGYCEETDVLTFGDGVETATVVAVNGDLVAYWGPDEYDPDSSLLPIAVDLRNAAKHLAPVIAATSQLVNVANG